MKYYAIWFCYYSEVDTEWKKEHTFELYKRRRFR